MAKNAMDQLIKSGKVRRGMLGVTIQPVTSDLASSFGLAEVRGALVSSVQAGSPAERAGIRRGDVIVALNGAPVTDSNSLRNQVARTQPGTDVTLTISRDNREQQVKLTLGELPAERMRAATDSGGGDATDTGKLGIRVELLTPALASRLNLQGNPQGLIVTDVDPVGPAARGWHSPERRYRGGKPSASSFDGGSAICYSADWYQAFAIAHQSRRKQSVLNGATPTVRLCTEIAFCLSKGGGLRWPCSATMAALNVPQ